VGRQRIRSEAEQKSRAELNQPSEGQLQLEMEELRRSIQEVKQSNNELSLKLLQKEEKRRHKRRTRELLQTILHKLEFINAELIFAKKNSQVQPTQQAEARELLQEFNSLKTQYNKMDQERRGIEQRQGELEVKLGQMISH
jgi:hypothetical protein